MKAKELMIGDWVLDKAVSDKPVQIEQINEQNVHYKRGKGYMSAGVELLEPIPLTKERLLANGFYYERNIGYVYDDGEYEVVVDLWNRGYRILHDRDVVMNIHCFSDVFVHELQHALRLCDVDKDIIIKED